MQSYWYIIWRQFKKRRLAHVALYVVLLYALIGLYAPFLASSKPFWVSYKGNLYFPLFRYLFFSGFFTKRLDIFFNLLMFLLPLGVFAGLFFRRWILYICLATLLLMQVGFFLYFILRTPQDPQADPQLARVRQNALAGHPLPSWEFDLETMTPYAELNLLLQERRRYRQQQAFQVYAPYYAAMMKEEGRSEPMPTLWQLEHDEEARDINLQRSILSQAPSHSKAYESAQAKLNYLLNRRKWIEREMSKLQWVAMPLLRPFHWEDDAGGSQSLNQIVKWWDLTRINRKDLVAALIFGVRISLVVGLVSVAIALSIAVPIGSLAGFYGGTFDILVSRLLEIWEAMPTFFMLLLVVAITQSKSIFLVISVIGLFGWTSFSRFLRGEFFKQRNLLYVES
jgi:peptide/nickel transport system permease protein